MERTQVSDTCSQWVFSHLSCVPTANTCRNPISLCTKNIMNCLRLVLQCVTVCCIRASSRLVAAFVPPSSVWLLPFGCFRLDAAGSSSEKFRHGKAEFFIFHCLPPHSVTFQHLYMLPFARFTPDLVSFFLKTCSFCFLPSFCPQMAMICGQTGEIAHFFHKNLDFVAGWRAISFVVCARAACTWLD